MSRNSEKNRTKDAYQNCSSKPGAISVPGMNSQIIASTNNDITNVNNDSSVTPMAVNHRRVENEEASLSFRSFSSSRQQQGSNPASTHFTDSNPSLRGTLSARQVNEINDAVQSKTASFAVRSSQIQHHPIADVDFNESHTTLASVDEEEPSKPAAAAAVDGVVSSFNRRNELHSTSSGLSSRQVNDITDAVQNKIASNSCQPLSPPQSPQVSSTTMPKTAHPGPNRKEQHPKSTSRQGQTGVILLEANNDPISTAASDKMEKITDDPFPTSPNGKENMLSSAASASRTQKEKRKNETLSENVSFCSDFQSVENNNKSKDFDSVISMSTDFQCFKDDKSIDEDDPEAALPLPPMELSRQQAGAHFSSHAAAITTASSGENGDTLINAELVVEDEQMRRSQIYKLKDELRQELQREAVAAEVIEQDPNGKRKRCLIIVAVSLVIVALVVGVLVSQLQPEEEEGRQPFFTTSEELYIAVDKWFKDNSSTGWCAVNYGWPIGAWDVSRIEDFSGMFKASRVGAYGDVSCEWNEEEKNWKMETIAAFDDDLSQWNTSNAKYMRELFAGATNFSGNISNWDVSKVIDFSYMFTDAVTFNNDISSWNTSSALSMIGMFEGALAFNQSLNDWDVSNVKDMTAMFRGARSFNGNLSGWNLAEVTSTESMFENCEVFSGYSIEGWDVTNVENLQSMFSGAGCLLADLSIWKTARATNMKAMFKNVLAFDFDVSGWIVSNVTDMDEMFFSSVSFRGDGMNSWNTSKVTSMNSMFNHAAQFVGDVSEWRTQNVESMRSMFDGATSFSGNLAKWDVSNCQSMERMFYKARSFNGDCSEWNTSKVTNMKSMFELAPSFSGDLSKWDVSSVTTMSYMFNFAESFNNDISGWNMSSVRSALSMLEGASSFNQSLCAWGPFFSPAMPAFNMFLDSGCLNHSDPILQEGGNIYSPICHICTEPNREGSRTAA